LVGASRPAYADAEVVPSCAVWRACGRWDGIALEGYNLNNNVWGDGFGPQCMWACSHSNFGVWADHPDTSGVKSYAHAELAIGGLRPSQMAYCTSSFNCTVPNAGAYTTAYDIWHGAKTEIMVWMNKQGAHEPWAHMWDANGPIPDASNITVGGHTWNYYWNGGAFGQNVYNLVRTTNTSAGTVDLKACLQWLAANTSLGDATIDTVAFGFEISASPGGMNFVMNSYDTTFGSNSTAVPAAPTNLTATVARATSINLAWTDNANNEDGFKIERGTDGVNFTEITTVGANIKTYTAGSLTTGTKYYFRVRAYNVGGNSAYSNVASGIPLQLGTGTGLKGDYYSGVSFNSLVLTRTDATVNFDWGQGSPAPSIPNDYYSVRWTGSVQPLYSETYTFYVYMDDGARLWVNNQLIVDSWANGRAREKSGTITLTAGTKYSIKLEYYENTGGATCKLSWSSANQGKQIVPQSQLYPQ
jgi:hypothetical protein